MFFVYLLHSEQEPERVYVGVTRDVQARVKQHNSSIKGHTQKYKPWKLVTTIAFDSLDKAMAFEKYLKSGSGRSFAKRHF